MTFDLAGFRTGRFSISRSSGDELPHGCRNCLYLALDETTVCFCDCSYYFCTYSRLGRLTDISAPCLQEA